MMATKSIWDFIKEIFEGFSNDGCFRLGAALAYYTIFALAPVLIIIIAVTGFFLGDEAMQGEIYRQINGLVGAESARQIQAMVEAASQKESGALAAVISAVGLIFGASGVFYVIKDSLNIIWKVKAVPKSGLAKFAVDRMRSLAIVLSIGFIMLVALIVNGVVAVLANYLNRFMPDITTYLIEAVNIGVSLLITTLLFAIIFKTLPDVKNYWSDVWVGAFVTAVLFALGKLLIGLYIGSADVGSTYGAAGSIIVILMWVYYASQILFLGAEFTFVYARRYGSGIRPSEHAVRVVQREVELDDDGRRIKTTER